MQALNTGNYYHVFTNYSYDLYFILPVHAVSSKNSDAKTTKNFCLTSCWLKNVYHCNVSEKVNKSLHKVNYLCLICFYTDTLVQTPTVEGYSTWRGLKGGHTFLNICYSITTWLRGLKLTTST